MEFSVAGVQDFYRHRGCTCTPEVTMLDEERVQYWDAFHAETCPLYQPTRYPYVIEMELPDG